MASSDDDEDLKRAIAMSLVDAEAQPASSGEIVDLTADREGHDEDEEMRRAIALSLGESQRSGVIDSVMGSQVEASVSHLSQHAPTTLSEGSTCTQRQTDDTSTSSIPYTSSGILGLDRKAMERERLARLGKRKRSTSPEPPSKLVAKEPPQPKPEEPKSGKDSERTCLKYPKGTIKRTWAHKHPRTNDITIEEVLQSPPPHIAVLSAYQWDNEWFFDKLDPERSKQIWIMSAKGEDVREKLLKEAVDCKIPNFKPHFPPMDGQVRNMHSKLMLLFHETWLRFVVTSANVTNVDWGETNKDPRTGVSWQPGVMENAVFLIDLPRRTSGMPAKEAETPFGKELVSFLRAQEVGHNVIEGILKFDFSQTRHLGFVHSIGGSHSGSGCARTGLPGLANCIRELHLDQVEHLELDCVASSLGALNELFLKQIYLAASGQSPLFSEAPVDFLDHIRVYFPTKDTVLNSIGGTNCGGIITLDRAHYSASSFPRKCLRDYKSTRPRVLSHNKLLLARGRKVDGTSFAWAYVGSANLTESAWGSQKILKSGKQGSLNIRNWECGVIVPVPDEKLEGLELGDGQVPPMSIFEGTIEVPFQYPGEEVEGKDPWFWRDYPT